MTEPTIRERIAAQNYARAAASAAREEITPKVKGPEPRLTVGTITSDQLDTLYAELAEMRGNYERACQTIAAMHEAAVGEVRGPNRGVVEDVEDVRLRAEETEAERDGAYRERAQLLALLASLHPSVIAPAPDVDEEGWQILYLWIGGKQASWHIAPRDAELYTHVEHVPADDRRAQWDGHTTEQKYAHIGQHAARLYAEARGRAETTRVFAALHQSAEQDVTRVIDLYERWVKAGPPPLGTSMSRWWDARLVELHHAIRSPEADGPPCSAVPGCDGQCCKRAEPIVDRPFRSHRAPACTCTYGDRCSNCRD